jgi:2-iminobutanoate/2-iminopropanoate deaminase
VTRTAYNPSPALTFPGMSQAVAFGDFVFLAGQCSMDENAQVVGAQDPDAQARQVFRNIEAVLACAGSTLADIVRLTCYAVSPAAYEAYARVKSEIFPSEAPAATTVIVSALLDRRFLLEVEATAIRGGRQRSR